MAKESERAAKLVGSFLSFARGQSGHREMVNLNEVIQRVADLRKFDFSVAGATLELDLDPNLPRTRADRDEIQQVFVNLINNSLQAMADIPGHARLKVQTKQKDGLIQVVVEDNGPGVPPDLLGKIFEPFFTTKQVGTGTGLGLSIAHSIMTDHKGRIVYQQSSLGGAGFLLEFPILSSSDGVPASEDALAASAARQSIDRGTALSRILVLDDEKELAEMLCEMLQILGHKPSLCHSSKQALDLIGKTRFDLIISDFRMPELNGQQFYELATRRFPELASRIVFITGDVINEETRTFLGSTGNPHIGKPFSLDKIKSVIAEVLNANASRVEERSSPQSQKSPPVAAG